jgi:hypothetical protein
VMAAISITYALLAVLELWRRRGEGVWRWPIMLHLLGHAAAIPVRIPLVGSLTGHHPLHVNLLIFVNLRDIISLHLRGIFARGSRQGSNCRPLLARLADRPTDGRCEPPLLSPGGRTADGPNPFCTPARRAPYI